MFTYVRKNSEGTAKYGIFPFFLLSLFLVTNAFADQKIFQESHYRVRQTGETCKLEIFLESRSLDRRSSKFWKHGFNSETIGFFSVFKTDDYFGELITEKSRVGLLKDGLSVSFDGKPETSVVASDSTGEDSLWKWRHFSYHDDILTRIRRSRKMDLKFSNGENLFHFSIPLKGSSKAIKFLQDCPGR